MLASARNLSVLSLRNLFEQFYEIASLPMALFFKDPALSNGIRRRLALVEEAPTQGNELKGSHFGGDGI
jgi:hypothetical protein